MRAPVEAVVGAVRVAAALSAVATAVVVLVGGVSGCLDKHRFGEEGVPPADASPLPDAGPPPIDASTVPPPEAFAVRVTLPDGTCYIGDHLALADPGGLPYARPYHEVFLSAYEIETEAVTTARYALCHAVGMCPNPPVGDDPEYTLDQAQAFCAWLDMTLPSEAQWERAVREELIVAYDGSERTLDTWNMHAYLNLPWANPLNSAAGDAQSSRGQGWVFSRLPVLATDPAAFRCAKPVLPATEVPTAPVPPACSDGCEVTQVVAGRVHSCALRSGGSVICWGDGGSGQLGTGSWAGAAQPAWPVAIDNATALAAGTGHTCAIADNDVWCWGSNTVGQLGDGTRVSSPTPKAVGLANAVALAAGTDDTCALLADGTVRCWGIWWGDADGSVPTALAGASGATHIAVGDGHWCVVDAVGDVLCWDDPEGTAQVTTGFAAPVQKLAAGDLHTCVVVGAPGAAGEAYCWGYRGSYQAYGSGTTVVPELVTGPWIDVLATSYATAVIRDTGTFMALVMDNPPASTGYPADRGATIGVGTHGCLVDATGTASCWGKDDAGQLGRGMIDPTGTVAPIPVVMP